MSVSFAKVLDEIADEIRSGPYSPIPALQRQFDRGTALDRELESYVRATPPGHGRYYQFLALVVRRLRPRLVVELGSLYGISTVQLLSELPPDGKLVSVDILEDQRYVTPEMRVDPRLRLVVGDCLDLAAYGDDVPCLIDLLFTDTVHTDRQITDEWEIYRHLLADGAVVIIDDIHVADKGHPERMPYEKWDLTELCHGNGFGVMRFAATEPPSVARAYEAAARVWRRRAMQAEAELKAGEALARDAPLLGRSDHASSDQA